MHSTLLNKERQISGASNRAIHGTETMAMTGYLSEYSLPELLYLLEVGTHTGYLKLQPKKEPGETPEQSYYIWFRQGHIISAFNQLGARNLIRLMCQRKLFDPETAQALLRRSPVESPFGLFLKEKGLLTAEQLKLIFSVQVIRQIRSLFTLEDAWFKFKNDSELPYSEMTGLNIRATEVVLPGLRALKNWTGLRNCLPAIESGLVSCVSQPTVRLKVNEQRVWSLADGETSLEVMAKRLEFSQPEVQQIAFCLISAGLAQEIPLATLVPATHSSSSLPSELEAESKDSKTKVSQSFLNNLEQFLADFG
ncbi:MAG: DUF4388 domain-containing protein [Leptolyngbya sp. SIO1D8]|nr:DUF4388 domain-containing protein [Leptolyngbya sp. SIO1D8]